MDREKLTVLLIEDDEDDYILVRELLERISTPRIALEWITTYAEGVDAICRYDHDICLLDYQLGAYNGLDLLHEVTARGCGTPVILLTGQGGYEVDLEAMKAGAADYLVKGQITAEMLDRSIRYSIERKHVENELRIYRNHLEEMVKERTTQLMEANDKLKQEIEERKRAEAKIQQQKNFLQHIMESLTHPFYVLDAENYSVIMANSAAAPDGLPPNITCHVLTHREESPCRGSEHFCPLDIIKRTKKAFTTEHIHYDRDGNSKNVEVHGYPIFDAQGRVVQILEYALDISERKKMEIALRKAHDDLEVRVRERTAELVRANAALQGEIAERKQVEERLRLDEARLEALWQLSQMSGASPRKIADFALDQHVRLTRSKMGWLGFIDEGEPILRLHAWSTSLMGDCTISDKPRHFPAEVVRLWANAVRGREAIIINDYSSNDREVGASPGNSHVSLMTRVMVIPVFDNGSIVAVAAVGNKEEDYNFADIRQSTLLLDGMWTLMRRERTEHAIRESERLAALGRALSTLAHDIKTPLIAIGGFSRMVMKSTEEGSPERNKLEIVINETRRLENMVKDMLDFSRPLQLEKSRTDFDRMVRECLELLEPVAHEKNVSIRNRPARDLSPVPCDVMRMKQAFINIVTNAVQATPAGESVTIYTYQRGHSLIVDVVDRGCGIPLEKRDEIFIPFITTKKEGTGLGLPIVKKIVDAHAGWIEIIDNPDKGLTFRMTIPTE